MIYFCLIAYVVAVFVRPSEIWVNFPFVAAIAVVSAVAGVLSYRAQPRKFWDLPHDRFIVGLWLAVVLSNLTWGWFGGAWMGFADFFKVVFFYFLIRFAVRETWQFRGLVATVIAVNVILAVSGILQFHWNAGLGGQPLFPDGRIRGTGIFNDPNDLALSLVMAVPFLLEAIGDRALGVARRLLALLLAVPLLVAILYTNSRGGMLSLGIILAGYAITRFGRVAGSIAIAVALLITLSWGPARFVTPTSADRESTQIRLNAWGGGLLMLKSDPIFGVGYNRFLEFHDVVAHSSFMHVIGELGLFGAFFWIGLHYWLVKGLLPRPPDGKTLEIDRLRVPLFASVMAMLVCSSFLSRQYVLVPYTLVGLGAAYVSIARAQGAQINVTISRYDVLGIIAICIAGIVGTWVWVNVFVYRAVV